MQAWQYVARFRESLRYQAIFRPAFLSLRTRFEYLRKKSRQPSIYSLLVPYCRLPVRRLQPGLSCRIITVNVNLWHNIARLVHVYYFSNERMSIIWFPLSTQSLNHKIARLCIKSKQQIAYCVQSHVTGGCKPSRYLRRVAVQERCDLLLRRAARSRFFRKKLCYRRKNAIL